MEKNVSRKNLVRIVGYLKENLLELVKNSSGENIIRGSLIIATSDIDSHKVQFYVSERDKNGDVSKDYENLVSLLPENTLSIASYLKNNPTANFSVASQMSTKVWVSARFDEFVKQDGDREISMILLKGTRGGIKSVSDTSPFVPGAQFTVEVYIDSLSPEIDANGENTGRANVVGYLPTYDKSAYKISFVAPAENNIAKYILANYKPADTVTLTGDVLSIAEVESKSAESSDFFGRSTGQTQYTTKFIRERQIWGGSKTPVHQGEEGSISTEEIKERLVVRESKIMQNNSPKKKTANNPAPKAPIPSKQMPAAHADLSDLDF